MKEIILILLSIICLLCSIWTASVYLVILEEEPLWRRVTCCTSVVVLGVLLLFGSISIMESRKDKSKCPEYQQIQETLYKKK